MEKPEYQKGTKPDYQKARMQQNQKAGILPLNITNPVIWQARKPANRIAI